MPDFLFDTDTLDNFLGKIRTQAFEAVEHLPEETVAARSDEEIGSELAARYEVEMVELDRDGFEPTQREVQIDVSGDPRPCLLPRAFRSVLRQG